MEGRFSNCITSSGQNRPLWIDVYTWVNEGFPLPETPDPGVLESQTQESAEPENNVAVTAGPAFAVDLDHDQAQPPHGLHYVFLGRDGLRAGWGLLLFFTLFLASVVFSRTLLQMVSSRIHGHPPTTAAQYRAAALAGGMSPKSVLAIEGVTVFSVLLATWVMAKVERRKISVYGFARQSRLRNFSTGLACGVALLSLLIVLLRAAGLLVFDARLLFGGSILHYGFIWAAGFMLVGIAEECATRAYAQFTLTRGLSAIYRRLFGESKANALGFWTAAILLSFLFGYEHRSNPGESPLGLLSAGLAGFLFSFSLWRTGSLWWALGFHAAWDWAQSFLYGVADSGLMVKGHLFATHPVGRPFLSGGLTGPEGSLLLLPVVVVGAIAIVVTLPHTHAGYVPASTHQASLN
jgi:membrane protease YdiL (CAAX protease family)